MQLGKNRWINAFLKGMSIKWNTDSFSPRLELGLLIPIAYKNNHYVKHTFWWLYLPNPFTLSRMWHKNIC